MNYLVVDAMNLAYRYFFALPPLSSLKTGIQTHVIFGWINFILESRNKLPVPKDAQMIAFFDSGGTEAGRELVEGYKATREERPATLTDQLPFLPIATRLLGIPYVKEQGMEADHLIGQFALRKYREGDTLFILTSDKDMLQLVNDRTFVVKPENGGNYKLMDRQAVYDRWKVYPENIPDLLLCMGDKSDNIPNVPGCGEKTAQALIQQYGSVTGIYNNLEELRPKMREAFETSRSQVEAARALVSFQEGEVRIRTSELDVKRITDLCRELDMTRTIGKIMDLYS